jgi:hypothetical protein
VVELEAALRREYEPLYQKWESDLAAWTAEKERLDDEAFAKCETPNERACFDIRRFLDYYYLTDGKADPTKTPETLVLHSENRENRLSDLSWKTRDVPGLHCWRSTCYVMEPITCYIGWDGDEITRLGKEWDDRERETKKAQRRSKWEENMEAHRQYLARTQSKKGNTDGKDEKSTPFDLSRLAGSYVIRCDAIMDEWDTKHTGDTLTMDVAPSSDDMLVAAYNFGIIRGTMTLCLSDDRLKEIFDCEEDEEEEEEEDSEAFISDEENEDDEAKEDDEDEGDDKDDEYGIDPEEPTSGNKRKASLEPGEEFMPSPKKQKTAIEPTPARRVYLRIESYETGEGEELHVPDAGYIDFTSNDCIAFEGLMKTLTYVGSKVKFEGYKISDEPQREPDVLEYVLI